MHDTISESWKVYFGFYHYFAGTILFSPFWPCHLDKGQSPDKHPACLRHLRASYLSTGRITSQGPSTNQVLRTVLCLSRQRKLWEGDTFLHFHRVEAGIGKKSDTSRAPDTWLKACKKSLCTRKLWVLSFWHVQAKLTYNFYKAHGITSSRR